MPRAVSIIMRINLTLAGENKYEIFICRTAGHGNPMSMRQIINLNECTMIAAPVPHIIKCAPYQYKMK